MKDRFGREINYLRISVTDRCNLRCVYCMDAEDFTHKSHDSILPLEQMAEIAGAAAGLGISKVRITGGEPLVRRGVCDLVRCLAEIPGITDIAMTTNGILLPGMAAELKEAGLQRVNISLDTLRPERYRRLSRVGELEQALDGIRAAKEAGFRPLKINTVLIGGVNDDEIESLVELTRDDPVELRFIELMPIGSAVLPENAYLPCSAVTDRIPALEPVSTSGTARLYRIPGYAGTVGLISPLSSRFCGSCNRIRLTADGHLKPCLHSGEEIDVSGLHGEELTEALREAIFGKPRTHRIDGPGARSESARSMNRIGG